MGLRSQNNPIASYRDVFSATGIDAVGAAPPGVPTGHIATGGVISDYSEGPTVYRAHIFTSSGIFNVTSTGDFGEDVEYLVVAGGGAGGGGAFNGGGGGAGGYRTGTGMPISAGSYPVTVGAGGAGIAGNYAGVQGGDSVFNNITSRGGGGGGAHDANPRGGNPGGSGGGGSQANGSAGTGNTPSTSPAQGYPGSGNWYAGAGGGGGAGGPHPGHTGPGSPPFTSSGGTQDKVSGGIGVRTPFGGPLYAIGVPGPGGTGGYLAGGGGGGGRDAYGVPQGLGKSGGGDGGPGPDSGHPGSAGTSGTGGGGGGCSGNTIPGTLHGGNGGSGIIVVRYQIGQLTATAKATGGAISFYNNKTIHTFTSSGTFENTSGSPLSVEYFAIAGGGAGGSSGTSDTVTGGGGGAGGVVTSHPGLVPATNPEPAVGPGSPNALTITVGAGGYSVSGKDAAGSIGNNTTITGPGPWSVTAYGGGGGGGNSAAAPLTPDRGSGGGGSESNGSSTYYTSTQGFAGSNGSESGNYAGNGGGAGSAAAVAAGGAGNGVRIPAVYRNPVVAPGPGTGPQVGGGLGSPGPAGGFYFGGGGSTTIGPNSGLNEAIPAGYGGGGGGRYNSRGQSGVENTGSGGGGGHGNNGGSGSGGSGIVLIAYPS